ncbi:histidine kinase [Jejudonia soesokkakensis]|uniref:Histidine kinase n=1 Tax=Jejudonia soesokkakensis TaxID=1323432 RepID=A0ABW2MWA8_9FLAO
MKLINILVSLAFLLCVSQLSAQSKRIQRPVISIEGEVVDSDKNTPLSKVNVEIVGGDYTTTNTSGKFRIQARVGDLIVIKSDEFETVYHEIKNNDYIKIRVEKDKALQPIPKATSREEAKSMFNTYIDSAGSILKKDAQKSIDYVTKAFEAIPGKNASAVQNSIAFEMLGDINLYWDQNDLAVDNFKRSLAARGTIDVKIKLAKAYRKNKNYQESITTYNQLLQQNLSSYQRVLVYEGLGDTYKEINDTVKSIFNYQKGLDLATIHSITPKITDLNSKIGAVYAQGGALAEAETYFDNSLSLSRNENKKRAVEEKNNVADFYNQKRDFDKEIQLRTEAIKEIQSLKDSEKIDDVNSPLTPQRQNYKIANAFLGQEKYEEAIPFLEKSIAEADAEEDLVVEKDATRKLSEIYRDIGNFDKAAESYERYVEVVDELYIKKEQEISQAARFSREITQKQNRIASLENERQINESRYALAFENQELIEKNNKVQKWVIGSLILIALLLLGMAYFQFKNVKQQKYANSLLALKSLRTQMNPHFIFNALNSVNSFIANSDERSANRYLSEFSQLMRSVLENSEEDFIPLTKEIELLELYTKLEHFRFQDKFEYQINIDEEIKLDEFVIPPMLLQPYVENAVWHGLRYKEEKGTLLINFESVSSEAIRISIIDNGIGRKKSQELKTENQKKQKSKGMGNTQKRIAILNKMYKDKVDVLVENEFQNEEGTRVTLLLKKD